MAQKGHTLAEFAAIIFGSLSSSEKKAVSMDCLSSIVDVLFWASLQTEELRSTNFSLLLIDPNSVDSEPPPSIRENRWRYIPFGNPIELTRHNLVKLGVAADSKSALLVTFPANDKSLKIWGLVDQQLAYAKFASHEDAEGIYALPKAMIIQTVGVGHIISSYESKPIAEYASGRLLQDVPDVLVEPCAISRSLKPGIESLFNEVAAELEKTGETRYKRSCSTALFRLWVESFKRLLCKIRENRHGGAILVASKKLIKPSTLNLKYRFDYDRLKKGLVQQAIHDYYQDKARFLLEEHYLDNEEEEMLSKELYFEEWIHYADKHDAMSSIEGAIQLLSSLVTHDGALLMSPDMHVRAFGVEILSHEMPANLVCATHSGNGRISYKKTDIEKYGTRHRSAARFCWKNPGTVAFIISQDGGVRAIAREGQREIFWESIKILERR